MTFSFAAYIAFYHAGTEKGDNCLIAKRGEDTYKIMDDQWVLDFFYDHKDDDDATLVNAVITNQKMWGTELLSLPGFEKTVAADLQLIREKGMYEALREIQQ